MVVDNSEARKRFKRKYSPDTHLGLHVASKLSNNGSLIKTSPGDRNVTPFKIIPGKRSIELSEKEKRDQQFQHYLLDAAEIRKMEILNKEDVPMVSLLQIISRNIPQKVESKNEHTFTFADMVKKATFELERVETVDVEAGG